MKKYSVLVQGVMGLLPKHMASLEAENATDAKRKFFELSNFYADFKMKELIVVTDFKK